MSNAVLVSGVDDRNPLASLVELCVVPANELEVTESKSLSHDDDVALPRRLELFLGGACIFDQLLSMDV